MSLRALLPQPMQSTLKAHPGMIAVIPPRKQAGLLVPRRRSDLLLGSLARYTPYEKNLFFL
jgi:hypothetical protein